jgi:hypothetical protein
VHGKLEPDGRIRLLDRFPPLRNSLPGSTASFSPSVFAPQNKASIHRSFSISFASSIAIMPHPIPLKQA